MSSRGSRAMATGFAIILLAVSAGVGSGGVGLLLGLLGILAGANLIAFSVWMADNPTTPIGSAVFAGVGALTAFLCRNLAVIGLAMASSAITAVAGEAGQTLIIRMFALLLLGLCLINIGVLGE